MIPVKLRISNFMCYRDNVPPLYFHGIHTACISGDNGNGKSALIDAMTWAVWGRSRAKSDDDLIYLGQAEMEVEFDFAVGQQTYRIIRKHSRPKQRGRSGQTIVELQTDTENGFRSITGNSINQTQQKIIDILHMDYDTFISSAFLRQGHADEFTRQAPARRKEVLANILGFASYDELEEQAKELARQRETNKVQLENALKDIADELAQKPVYEAEFERAQAELSGIEKTIKEQESNLNMLRKERESLENKKSQLERLREHFSETNSILGRWDDQLRQQRAQIKEHEELIGRRSTIEAGYNQFIETKKQKDELDRKLTVVNRLNQHRYDLEKAIFQASHALLKEHALIESSITQMEISHQKLPTLKNDWQQAQAELQRLTGLEEQLRGRKQSAQELHSEVVRLESDSHRVKVEIEEIEEKLKLLVTSPQAKCPLCETDLGAEGLKLIEAKYTADRKNKSDQLESGKNILMNKKGELASLESEVSRQEARLSQDKATAQSQTALLSQRIAEAEEAGSRLNEARLRLAEVEQQQARKEFAVVEQEKLRELEGEIARLDYNPQQHEDIRQRLTTLEKYETPKRKLEEADRVISQEREAAARAEEAMKELRQALEVDKQKGEELNRALAQLPELLNTLTRAETEHQELAARQKHAQETVGSIKAKLQRCLDLEIKKAEKEGLLSQTLKEERIYRDLAEAFGKKGIQALLIEIALPEIESEADKLLGRMTDNRMHVKIETQRETKKGETVETLDIMTSDELGTRNYEMFSGGEAFRIDFAIRIALSRLLAHRAGAPLPTLIIDEGFGTQDNTGIEKLKEAINSIQDDFEKIFVITHIEEFRDAFPTRINVVKTAGGSTIEVS